MRRASTPLRRSLRYCTAEGAAAEVVGACCGGAALTGWALHLGMDVRLVGAVAALPLVAQVLQPIGAILTARFGYRRTALVCIALARQAFLPLVLLPILPLGPAGRRTLLLSAAGIHHGVGMLSNNAWNVWFGELVPARVRGRYFGRRTAFCTVVGGACALAAGLALDHGPRRESATPVLQGLALLASIAGLSSVVLMAHQHSTPSGGIPAASAARALLAPLRDPRARRVIAYNVVWNGACGLSAPFFGLFVLGDLRSGYALLAAEGAGLAAARISSASAWGRLVDRAGARCVLVGCTTGLALSPLAWIACAPDRLWPLAVEAVVGGVLLGGHAVASFALPLSVAPRRERPFYLAAIAMAGGAAFAATSLVGCALTGGAAGHAVPLRTLLVGSSALRVLAIGTAFALPGRRWRPRLVASSGNAVPAAAAAPVPVALRDAA